MNWIKIEIDSLEKVITFFATLTSLKNPKQNPVSAECSLIFFFFFFNVNKLHIHFTYKKPTIQVCLNNNDQ